MTANQLLLELINQATQRGLELANNQRSGLESINWPALVSLVSQLKLNPELIRSRQPVSCAPEQPASCAPEQRRRWARTPEAAAHAGASASTFEKYRLLGTGPPYHKLGPKIVIYDLDELDKWLEARRRSSTSDLGNETAELKARRVRGELAAEVAS
jgi:hypothetical protein